MAGTPIKVPGKNTRDSSKSAVLARKIMKRPPGRPLKKRSPKVASQMPQSFNSILRESKVRTLKNIKSRRKMSELERLPTEILEQIFFGCWNLSLPACSPVIGGKLSSVAVYNKIIIAAFGPVWDKWYGQLLDPRLDLDYSGNSSLQSTILKFRWAKLPMLLQGQDLWVQKYALERPFPLALGMVAFHHGDDIEGIDPKDTSAAELLDNDFAKYCNAFQRMDVSHTTDASETIDFMSSLVEKREQIFDLGIRNYANVARGTEIPHTLLMGPWDEKAVKFLFWLVMGGARIDWLASTSGEAAIIGYKNAVRECRIEVIHLLLYAGVNQKLDEDIFQYTLENADPNRHFMTILLMVYPPYQDPYPWIIEEIFRFRSGHEHENDNKKVSSNPRQGHSLDHAPHVPASSLGYNYPSRSCRRPLSTSLQRRATVEAGFQNPKFLGSRLATSNSSSNATQPKRATLSSKQSATQNRSQSSRGIFTGARKWPFKLWSSKRDGKPLQPDDLPHLSEDGREIDVFSLGRSVSVKAASEPRLRCTELDENGNVVLVNGEFKKSELIAKYGLLPRDLRKIDSSTLPHILVRPSAILINLLHLRVLIKSNRVLIFDAYGSTDTYTQSLFMYDLEGKLSQKQTSASAGALPYEFRALEAVLISVTSGLEKEFETVREPVVRVLKELEEDIDRDKLRYLLIYSKKLGTFEQKAKLVRDSIDELLEADDDLAAMYLTEKDHDLKRGEDDHTEVEMLLESYHKLCDEIVQESGNLVSNIRNTEEIVKAILDANRNSLMLLELKISIGTLGMGSGAFIAALYGMNLKNHIEESDLGFLGVSGWCGIFAAIVWFYGISKLKKVQRVSMWGESGMRGRNWRVAEDETKALEMDKGRRDRGRRLKEERGSAMEEVRAKVMEQRKSIHESAQAAGNAEKRAREMAARSAGHGHGHGHGHVHGHARKGLDTATDT
ncbi:putative inner membrane magnesium transporter mrs2 protein [Botrytis fragariae]|uniref:Mitochondrial inner membrane magnesium transporter MRS2 n=1 Tax=Botrytis fragariae TaxID=1964551 RepID=A0A8H6ASS6_9HELO|nr:putative inner membrane magnesium transporter mrs2 protein [Botrytis fragariae]KAF5872962.1 putative inner membrane magnesium transporter mrs2 protein [Botrytis fragariae]